MIELQIKNNSGGWDLISTQYTTSLKDIDAAKRQKTLWQQNYPQWTNCTLRVFNTTTKEVLG